MRTDPVFVAGLERSGTSLMYALLASHPNVSMTRRTNFWRYFADQFGDLDVDANLDACLETMRVYKRMRSVDVDVDALRAEFLTGPRSYGRLFALLEEQVANRRGKQRWGDKSLDIERYADRLMAEYPDAVILHMVRDPRDRLASVIARWKSRRAALGVATAAWLWSARLAHRNAQRHGPRYRIVRYESLVGDPDGEMRAVCELMGEPFDERMFSMDGAEEFRDQGSNSSYGARQSGVISADSIGRFARVLTPRQVAFVDRVAGPEMRRLGYDPSPVGRLGLVARAASVLVDQPVHRAAMAAWRLRGVWRDRRGRTLPEYRKVEVPA